MQLDIALPVLQNACFLFLKIKIVYEKLNSFSFFLKIIYEN